MALDMGAAAGRPLPLDPDTIDETGRPRDCHEPPLFDWLWERGAGRWMDVDVAEAAKACGIREASVVQELRQMVRRGSVEWEYVSGIKPGDDPILLIVRPLRERTYTVHNRGKN